MPRNSMRGRVADRAVEVRVVPFPTIERRERTRRWRGQIVRSIVEVNGFLPTQKVGGNGCY
jgi:hypothetical protein